MQAFDKDFRIGLECLKGTKRELLCLRLMDPPAKAILGASFRIPRDKPSGWHPETISPKISVAAESSSRKWQIRRCLGLSMENPGTFINSRWDAPVSQEVIPKEY